MKITTFISAKQYSVTPYLITIQTTFLLGDAVVEFITSVHLFHMFPDLEEGGLATYRAALVQNQHLAILAEVLGKSLYDRVKISFEDKK